MTRKRKCYNVGLIKVKQFHSSDGTSMSSAYGEQTTDKYQLSLTDPRDKIVL